MWTAANEKTLRFDHSRQRVRLLRRRLRARGAAVDRRRLGATFPTRPNRGGRAEGRGRPASADAYKHRHRPDADPKNGQLRRRDDQQPPDGDLRQGNARPSRQYRRRRQQRNHRDRAKRAEHLCARLRSLAGSAHRRRRAGVSSRQTTDSITRASRRPTSPKCKFPRAMPPCSTGRTAWAAPSIWSRASRCARWKANCSSRNEFGRDGTYEGLQSAAYLGTKQQNYYAQVSGTWRDMKGWMLPESFSSTPDQGWGFRDGSGTYDWNVNAKVGWTPNATDEYSLSFMHQEGKKGSPFNVIDPLVAAKESPHIRARMLGTGPIGTCKASIFSPTPRLAIPPTSRPKPIGTNSTTILSAYSNPWVAIQNTPAAFNSVYNDYALGAGVEAGTVIAGVDTIKTMLEYRLDAHNAWEQYYGFKGYNGCVANVVCYEQPIITSLEDTYSVAVENTYRPTPQIDLVQGFGYDWRHLRQAEDFNSSIFGPRSPRHTHSASSIIRLPTPARRASKARRSTISQIRKRLISTFRIATASLRCSSDSVRALAVRSPIQISSRSARSTSISAGPASSLRAPRCRWTCSTT